MQRNSPAIGLELKRKGLVGDGWLARQSLAGVDLLNSLRMPSKKPIPLYFHKLFDL
jgi:hypothetical protein